MQIVIRYFKRLYCEKLICVTSPLPFCVASPCHHHHRHDHHDDHHNDHHHHHHHHHYHHHPQKKLFYKFSETFKFSLAKEVIRREVVTGIEIATWE